jgi:hypothetical protein
MRKLYTQDELMDIRPKELIEIILELQKQIEGLRKILEATQSNQLSEEMVEKIIVLVLSGKKRPFTKIKELIQIMGG